ncbi:hypothetical protein [Microbacterium sp. gxy059]|uniref:hypothetical protein n=1 Tax=Microbacterium sp. gxy059 TaxID=2957199 RepID=UPI003D95EC0D
MTPLEPAPNRRARGPLWRRILSVAGLVAVVITVPTACFALIASERPDPVAGEPLEGVVIDKHSVMTRTSDTCGFAFIEIGCNVERQSHELVIDVGHGEEGAVDVVVDWTPLTFLPTTWRACDIGDRFARDGAGEMSCAAADG